jgi:hypothetical protein
VYQLNVAVQINHSGPVCSTDSTTVDVVGIGVGGELNAGGETVHDSTVSTAATNGALIVTGGGGITTPTSDYMRDLSTPTPFTTPQPPLPQVEPSRASVNNSNSNSNSNSNREEQKKAQSGPTRLLVSQPLQF